MTAHDCRAFALVLTICFATTQWSLGLSAVAVTERGACAAPLWDRSATLFRDLEHRSPRC